MAENPLGAVAAFDATLRNATKKKPPRRKRAPKAPYKSPPRKPAAQTIASSGPLPFAKAVPAARNTSLNRRVPHINRLVRQIAFRPNKRDSAFNTLRGLNLTDAELRYVQIELRKLAPAVVSGYPSLERETPEQRKNFGTHGSLPQYGEPGFTGLSPKNLKWLRHEAAINRRNQAELEAIVNPFSGRNIHNLGDIAWEMTGIPTLSHPIRSGPVDTGLAALGFIPGVGGLTKLGKVAKIGKAGKVGEEAAAVGRVGRLEARRARKALIRGPRRTPEEARKAVAERNALDAQALDRAGAKGERGGTIDLTKEGEAPPELGGVPGQIYREAMNPSTKGKGQYHAVGTKLDDPKRLREEQEALRAPERSVRGKNILRASADKKGIQKLYAAKAVLEGEYPKVEYRGLAKLTDELRDDAVDFIFAHRDLGPFEKVRAAEVLDAAIQGRIPTKKDIFLLDRVFGREVSSNIIRMVRQRGFGQTMNDLLGVPRALRSAIDFSAPGRQAFPVLFSHPGLWLREYGPAFKGMFSEKRFQAAREAEKELPTAASAEWARVARSDIGKDAHGVEDIYQREEAMPSNFAEQIPGGIGAAVRGSDRGYVGFLNSIRSKLFDRMMHHSAELGYHLTDEHVQDIAKLVNTLTGRGDIKHLQAIQPTLNALLFSPRLLQSRINLLNPYFYYKLSPYARREALKTARNFYGTLGVVLLLIDHFADDAVSFDPRSADFGKIRKGDTRIDLGAGFNQLIHLYGEFAPMLRPNEHFLQGQRKSTTTGRVSELGGGGYGEDSLLDAGLQFMFNKANPVVGGLITTLKGNQFGRPLDFSPNPTHTDSVIANLWEPMSAQDALATAQETGNPLAGLAAGLTAATGVGVQSYPTPKKDSPDKVKAATTEALTELRKKMNALNVPAKYRPVYAKYTRMKVARDLAKDQARYMAEDGKITDLESYRITLDTLARNGLVTQAQARRAVAAVSKMTDREIRHWEYEAWEGPPTDTEPGGPGYYLRWLNSDYNEKTGE